MCTRWEKEKGQSRIQRRGRVAGGDRGGGVLSDENGDGDVGYIQCRKEGKGTRYNY
jgi:hypothetical protein